MKLTSANIEKNNEKSPSLHLHPNTSICLMQEVFKQDAWSPTKIPHDFWRGIRDSNSESTLLCTSSKLLKNQDSFFSALPLSYNPEGLTGFEPATSPLQVEIVRCCESLSVLKTRHGLF